MPKPLSPAPRPSARPWILVSLISTLLAPALVVPMAASAQEPASAPSTPAARLRQPAAEAMAPVMLPEVVVTAHVDGYRATESTSATRLAEPIFDTPRAVSVVTPELLRDRQIVDPQEAIQNVSAVQRSVSRTGTTETYIVRGFTQDGLFKDGFRSGQLSGGSVFSFEGPTDVANLDRIEVLKGPSAILYGRGETGGTVNYITNAPVFENHFSLQQQFGSYDFYRPQLNLNWQLIPSRLALRLDGAYQNSGSFIDFVEDERYFVAPALKLQIGPDTTLTFRGEYLKDRHSTTLSVPYVNGEILPSSPYNRYYGEPGFSEIHSDDFRGLIQLDHKWNESHHTTLALNGVHDESTGGNFILFNFAGPLVDPVTGAVSRAAERFDYTDEFATARLDHTWDWTVYEGAAPAPAGKDGKSVAAGWSFPTVKNQLLVSAEFERQSNEGSRILSGHTPLDPVHPHYTGYKPQPLVPGFPDTFQEFTSVDADAYSLLFMDRISFGDRVFISGGGRYEWFDASSRVFYPVPVFPNGNDGFTQETFNPFVGVVVKPFKNLSLYGNYAESTNSFKNIGLRTSGGSALDPENSRQYEAGAKLELLDGKFLATLSLFQIEKDDVADVDPANPFFLDQCGR